MKSFYWKHFIRFKMHKANGINPPEHLDKAFFEIALENGLHKQFVEIKQIRFSSGSSAGENYCSQIYRVSIVYTDSGQSSLEEVSVIVKVMPPDESLNFLEAMNVFNKEKWLLMEILPQFEILLSNVQFAPVCYHAVRSPIKTIVLQDMGSYGFEMADREIGLDECHVRLTLKKLAHFHAVSMVYGKKKPLMLSNYNRGLLDPKGVDPSSTLYQILYKHLAYEIKLASKWEGFEEITKKLQHFHNNFDSCLYDCQKSRNDELKVLNHGDFWVNNLLFKYDPQNNPVDLVFIDFQISYWGSPGIDLNYFLFASAQFEVMKKWKTMLEVYHSSLRDTLLELSYDEIPTYEDIEKEFKQKSAYGLFTLIGPLPIMTMSKNEGTSFEELARSDEKTKIIFSSTKLAERLKYSLVELDKMGAFDAF